MPPGIKGSFLPVLSLLPMALTTRKDGIKRISHAQHGPSPWPRLDSRSDQVSLQGDHWFFFLLLPCWKHPCSLEEISGWQALPTDALQYEGREEEDGYFLGRGEDLSGGEWGGSAAWPSKGQGPGTESPERMISEGSMGLKHL